MRLIDADKLHLKLLDMEFPIQDQDPILDAIDDCTVDAGLVVNGRAVTKNRPITYDVLNFIGTRENAEPVYTISRRAMENNPVDYCSVCGKRLCSRFTNYCPNCGTKMVLLEKEGSHEP